MFNKLLHQDPESKKEVVVKKDRSMSKKDRIKKEKEAKMKFGEVDEEDNKVLELVLKGVYAVMVKSSKTRMDSDLKKLIEQ